LGLFKDEKTWNRLCDLGKTGHKKLSNYRGDHYKGISLRLFRIEGMTARRNDGKKE
jgi:hypothetical protein